MKTRTIELRAFIVWLVMIGTEVINGTLRTLFLTPCVGDLHARQIGVFTGSLLILGISLLLIRWIGVIRTGSLIFVGCFWLVLTVAFELLLGRFAFGYSWERLAADYNILGGGLMPLGLAVLTLAPLTTARLRTFMSRRRGET